MRFMQTVARVPRTNARRPRRFSSAGWEELGSRRGLVRGCQRGPESRKNAGGKSVNSVRAGKRERERGNGRDCACRAGQANRRRVPIAAVTMIAIVCVAVRHRHARHFGGRQRALAGAGMRHGGARHCARPEQELERERQERGDSRACNPLPNHVRNLTPHLTCGHPCSAHLAAIFRAAAASGARPTRR